MRRETIVKELIRRGYRAEKYETVKNGVICKGIVIRGENGISPVIYTDALIREEEREGNSVAHIANRIAGIYEDSKNIKFDKELLLDEDFILKQIRVGIQKKSTQHLEKFPCKFPEMEMYLYFFWEMGMHCSTKLTPEYLSRVGISSSDAWLTAFLNTFRETRVISMTSLGEKFRREPYDPQMYILTNVRKAYGASAIMNLHVLKKLDEEVGNGSHKFFVLPSSIHEMILIPYDEKYELDDLSEMVRWVNATEVEEEEQLSDKAYILDII